MSFEQEKMIVGSLPSLYPLQKFEEEAINALVSLQIDDDTISRKAALELCDWYDNPSMREDLEKLRPVRFNADTISRRQAIGALEKVASFFPYKIHGKPETYDKYNEAWNDAIGRAELEINELPLAQLGTNLAEVGTDCISRRQAIGALTEYGHGRAVYIGVDTAVGCIDQLPPAQPEQLEQCPIYGGMCAYPSNQCYDCPRHAGAKMEVTT